METRTLGKAGPALSVVGLGCNNFGMAIDAKAAAVVVHAALEAGITHFDTAEMYGGGQSEEMLGAALGARRDEAIVATKFLPRPAGQAYEPGVLAARIREGAETSLRRLRTDRIDLYYQHMPDPEAPVEEALEALDGLVRAGKVLHIASSNVTADQIAAAASAAEARGFAAFAGTQIHWNLLNREVEESVVPAAEAAGLGVVPYFPLASGLLTGKYRRGEPFPPGTRLARNERFAGGATDENFDRRRTGSPAGSTSPSRSSTAENMARICTRARWAPRQKWGPCPNVRCSLGERAGSNRSGSGNISGSRLAAENHTTTLSPART